MQKSYLLLFYLALQLPFETCATFAAEATTISQVQGAGHDSSMQGRTVRIKGILTKKTNSAFYMQDPNEDQDAATSEGILVARKPPDGATINSLIEVEGIVREVTNPFGNGLSVTQIKDAVINSIAAGQPIAATVIGRGGRVPPAELIDDDMLQSFDPITDGIDFWETLEGMFVRVATAQAVSPVQDRKAWIVADEGNGATGMNQLGGITITPGDFNPERIQIQFEANGGSVPQLNVGDRLAFVEGVVTYTDGNFKILVTDFGAKNDAPVAQLPTITPSVKQLTIAGYNVENLDPIEENENRVGNPNDDIDDDVGQGKFKAIALQLVQTLGSPDIIALQELQDDDGAEYSSVVTSDKTASLLIEEIIAVGGPRYTFVEKVPTDDKSGGQPGGNIRVGYLFNPARVTLDALSVTAIDDPAFSDTRRPLAVIFEFNSKRIRVINIHFESKGGDSPLLGKVQPPITPSDQNRIRQAHAIKRFLRNQPKAADATIVLGDFNAFQFELPLLIATDGGEPRLVNLTSTLPPAERWSYIFEGNSQALDHILIDAANASRSQLTIMHVNAGFAKQTSDHDPSLLQLAFD